MRLLAVSFGNNFPPRLHCITRRLTKMKNQPEDYSHYSRCIATADSDLSGARVPTASRRRQKDRCCLPSRVLRRANLLYDREFP